jgi:hypothetical protein
MTTVTTTTTTMPTMTTKVPKPRRFTLQCNTCHKEIPVKEIKECPVTYRSLCQQCYDYDDIVHAPRPKTPPSPWPLSEDEYEDEYEDDSELDIDDFINHRLR